MAQKLTSALFALIWLAIFPVQSADFPATSLQLAISANPIMPGADPHTVLVDGVFWMYPTHFRDERRFYAWSSPDLQNWEQHGPVLDFKDIPWIDEDGAPRHYGWAPCIAQKNGKVYFYYSVGPQNPRPARLGVAVGNALAGPFVDSGKPLLTGGNGFEAIDPMVFTDAASGKTYLYAGGSAGASLRVFELGDDMISLARQIDVKTPPKFTEGVFMHEHQRTYYLSYSHGSYRHSSYSLHYATASSPIGPWNYRSSFLVSDNLRKGPGHHSLIEIPGSNETLLFYHRWENVTGDGPYPGSRQLAVDKLEYDTEGLIRPVSMTSRPRPEPARKHGILSETGHQQ